MAVGIESTDTGQRKFSASQGYTRYLSVAVAGQRFAIPLDRVIGVTESTMLTPLPFSPPPFEGLVLAMGQVVPQIGLAALLGLKTQEAGVLVLISDLGGSVGLRVDQVHAMIQVDPEQITLTSSEERADAPMILGRFGEGAMACSLLNLDHLTTDTGMMTFADSGAVLLASETGAGVLDEDEASPDQTQPYLMLDVSDEVYAIKIDHLVELLELSTLRPAPHAPAWIAGLIDRRGAPLLGLSLAVLLGRPEGKSGKLGVVVALEAGDVALIADHSLGIERYAADQVHGLREPVAGIASYLVKADGTIVGILDTHTLLRPVQDEVRLWTPQATTAPVAVAAPVKPMEFHQYLTLRIGREFLAVPLDRIQRLEASIEMTPIPDRGTGFHGLADVGDAVVPVIDLRQVLSGGAEPIVLEANPPCLLAMVEGGIAGVIVHQVLRIETVPESQISPAEDAHNLPISQILHIHDRLMSVVSLDRLLPPL